MNHRLEPGGVRGAFFAGDVDAIESRAFSVGERPSKRLLPKVGHESARARFVSLRRDIASRQLGHRRGILRRGGRKRVGDGAIGVDQHARRRERGRVIAETVALELRR